MAEILTNPIVLAGLAAGSFYAVTRATEPVGAQQQENQVRDIQDDPNRLQNIAKGDGKQVRNQALLQDAGERGFFNYTPSSRRGGIYDYETEVHDPNQVSIWNFGHYKQQIQRDHNTHVDRHARWAYDHEYQKPLPATAGFGARPLIGLPNSTCRVMSGMNKDGNLALLASNPFTQFNNVAPNAVDHYNDGYKKGMTYGTANTKNYDRYGVVRMAWQGLHNPWRPSGMQYRLHRQHTAADRDQLLGKAPLAHPPNVFDPANQPSDVTAPMRTLQSANVFNRQVSMGRNH